MHHHREVRAVEGAGVDEVDLAAATLLSRGTEHRHAQAGLVGDGSQGDPRSNRGRGDDVVPTGVADSGQGVVLGADDELRPRRPCPSGERGGEPVRTPLDVEPSLFEQVSASSSSAYLLVGELRIGRDGVRERDELGGYGVEPLPRRRGHGGGEGSGGHPRILSHGSGAQGVEPVPWTSCAASWDTSGTSRCWTS